MDFITKTELFFIQLQYCLTIEPEPILAGEKGVYSLMLQPAIFLKWINDFKIDYPFIVENKIIELNSLMNKEGINTKDALRIFENYKEQYWFIDSVVMFEPVIDNLKRTLKGINSEISDKEMNLELLNYQKHLQEKRQGIYVNLIDKIKANLPQQTEAKTNQALPKFEEQPTSCENLKELEDSLYKSYANSIVSKRNLLITVFKIALDGTIDKNKLIKMEINNIDKTLEGELGKNFTIFDRSNILIIEPEYIKASYEKLIRGLEVDILRDNLGNIDKWEEIESLETTKALLFYKKYLTTLINSSPPNQTETKTDQALPNFENNFDRASTTDVLEYFTKHLLKPGYIKKKDLHTFLINAFELKKHPGEKIKLKGKYLRKDIRLTFYNYYKMNQVHGTKEKYVKLLSEHFQGFETNNLMTNFSKDY